MVARKFTYDDGYEKESMTERELDSRIIVIANALDRDHRAPLDTAENLDVGEKMEGGFFGPFVTVTRTR